VGGVVHDDRTWAFMYGDQERDDQRGTDYPKSCPMTQDCRVIPTIHFATVLEIYDHSRS